MELALEKLNKNQTADKAFKDSGSKQRASRGTQKKELVRILVIMRQLLVTKIAVP